ncbi:hypothetical protein Tco_1292822 [Tanacetum coccineum]
MSQILHEVSVSDKDQPWNLNSIDGTGGGERDVSRLAGSINIVHDGLVLLLSGVFRPADFESSPMGLYLVPPLAYHPPRLRKSLSSNLEGVRRDQSTVEDLPHNMTFENSDEGGESTQELQNLIKELGYRNAMDVEDVLTHPEENVVAQLLTDEEIIESVIGINKDDIDEEDDESSTMEPPSRNEAIKAAITLNNFLLSYEKTTPEVLTMLRKIRDEIQGEIDFNKKQKTIESFFKKPS